MEYKIFKNVITISSGFGLFTCPLKQGIASHIFARKYCSILADAIERAVAKDFKGITSSLFNQLNMDELDNIVVEVFEGLSLNGEPVNMDEIHLPIELTFQLLLIIIEANCKPLLSSKYKPSRVVSQIQAKSKVTPNRSLENVTTSSLGEVKLLILSLACSEFNGGHDYQWFLDECPLETFYDLLEYRTIRTSVEAESHHYQQEQQKRTKR